MVMKVIPNSSGRTPAPAFAGGTLRDTLGRSMHDLSISVTDRCNFRCMYCKPREVFDANYTFAPHSAILRAMNDVDCPVAKVIEGIDAAAAAGLSPVKVNMVVKRGVNDRDILPMAERWRSSGHIARFIEYMDVGSSNGWRMDDVVPSAEVVRRISERWPLEPVGANYAGEVAARWRYVDGAGEIGVISSVTQAFCGSCTRMRLSTEGALFTCLFAQSGHDLKSLVRGGASDEEIRDQIAAVWQRRADRYSEIRTSE